VEPEPEPAAAAADAAAATLTPALAAAVAPDPVVEPAVPPAPGCASGTARPAGSLLPAPSLIRDMLAAALKLNPASAWIEYVDESDGQSYFHNPVTAETVWEMPAEGISASPDRS
jgi:hypothetical protein